MRPEGFLSARPVAVDLCDDAGFMEAAPPFAQEVPEFVRAAADIYNVMGQGSCGLVAGHPSSSFGFPVIGFWRRFLIVWRCVL